MRRVKSYIKLLDKNKDEDIKLIREIINNTNLNHLSKKKLLHQFELTFELRTSRIQSILLCEDRDSYSVQSQRYCTYDEDAEYILEYPEFYKEEGIFIDIDKIEELLSKTMNIYTRLINDYNFESEDARHILTMVMPCYTVMTIKADKLFDLYSLFVNNYMLFADFMEYFNETFSLNISIDENDILVQTNSDYLNDEKNKLLEYKKSKGKLVIDDIDKAALAALTCTNEMDIESLRLKYPKKVLTTVINNVALKLRHESILEHISFTYNGKMSLVAYNQFIRHRFASIIRPDFISILNQFSNCNLEKVFDKRIYDKLKNTDLYQEIEDLFEEFRKADFIEIKSDDFNDNTKKYYVRLCNILLLQLIVPLGICIDISYTDNLRDFCHIGSLRICNRAQDEIHNFVIDIYNEILNANSVLFDVLLLASPSCVTEKCHEGNKACKYDERLNIVKLFEKEER